MILRAKLEQVAASQDTSFVIDESDSGEATLSTFLSRGSRRQRTEAEAGVEMEVERSRYSSSSMNRTDSIEMDPSSESSSNAAWDIIVVDEHLQCGGMLGSECTAALREAGCTAFIIACSANCTPADREYYMEKGANLTWPKPFPNNQSIFADLCTAVAPGASRCKSSLVKPSARQHNPAEQCSIVTPTRVA
jgi:CheY-like chemotaxis protein